MARAYEIPPNTNEEEKAIGGMMTFTQFFWLLGSGVIGLGVFLLFFIITGVHVIAGFFGVIVFAVGFPFAFYRKCEMPLFTYLMRKRKFEAKSKHLINSKEL